MDELEPGNNAQLLAYEYELRARALRDNPAIADLGEPGDNAFETAIEAQIDLIDGTAEIELEMERQWLAEEDDRDDDGEGDA